MSELRRTSEILAGEPLREVTRSERRNLLAASAIGFAVVRIGLLPTKIAAFGIEFGRTNQQGLLLVLSVVLLYFLFAFLVYALSDIALWWTSYGVAKEAAFRNIDAAADIPSAEKLLDYAASEAHRLRRIRPIAIIRMCFEFLLPIILGLMAFIAIRST